MINCANSFSSINPLPSTSYCTNTERTARLIGVSSVYCLANLSTALRNLASIYRKEEENVSIKGTLVRKEIQTKSSLSPLTILDWFTLANDFLCNAVILIPFNSQSRNCGRVKTVNSSEEEVLEHNVFMTERAALVDCE